MSNYDWFNIGNKTDFEDAELTSRTVSFILGDYGKKDILITKGAEVSVLIDDVFLTIGLNDKSPFEFEDRAVGIDEDDNIWVGILVPDED